MKHESAEHVESPIYQAAVEIGTRANRQQTLVAIWAVCVVGVMILLMGGAILYYQFQLHEENKQQQSQIAKLLSTKANTAVGVSARNQAILLASTQGIRCILSINPNIKRTFPQEQKLIGHCFATFDLLNKEQP